MLEQLCSVALSVVLVVFLVVSVVSLVLARAPEAAVECVRQDLCFWLDWPNEIFGRHHFCMCLSAEAEHVMPFTTLIQLLSRHVSLYIFHSILPSVLFSSLRIAAT